MITYIELQNVRVFADDVYRFNLSPLTVFCGTNSAGKSTILKSLLFLRQNLDDSDNWIGSNNKLLHPIFTGNIVNLGSYETLVSYGEIKRDISIGIGIKHEEISDDYLIGEYELDAGHFAAQQSTDVTTSARFTFSRNQRISSKLSLSEYNNEMNGYLKRIDLETTIDGTSIVEWSINKDPNYRRTSRKVMPYSTTLQRTYVEKFVLTRSRLPEQFRSKKIMTRNTFPISLNGLLPSTILFEWTDLSENGKRKDHMLWPIVLLNGFRDQLRTLERSFSSISHIGPLRSPAQRHYIMRGEEVSFDSSGNSIPFRLRDSQNRNISYVRPNSTEAIQSRLSEALDDWLFYFRTGETLSSNDTNKPELKITEIGGILLEIKLRTPSGNNLYSMLDSGFGLSQVLPIIIALLELNEGKTVVIEQPELHLNPSIQIRLAHFFTCMIRAGKQILIETHSEHIVNAIRVFAAEDSTGYVAHNSRLYFLDSDKGKPIVYDMSIREDGSVPEWPPQFFGEALHLTGRLLKAQKRHRTENK